MYLSKEVWNDIEGNLLENSMAPSNFISVMKRPFWNSQSMNGGQYRNVEWISNYFPRSQRRLNIREERGEKSNSVTPTWIWRRQIQFGNQLHSLTYKITWFSAETKKRKINFIWSCVDTKSIYGNPASFLLRKIWHLNLHSLYSKIFVQEVLPRRKLEFMIIWR